MHIDLKLEHIRRRMDKLHERNARHGGILTTLTESNDKEREDLLALCAILTDAAKEYAQACGASDEVTAAVIAPKDDPKP